MSKHFTPKGFRNPDEAGAAALGTALAQLARYPAVKEPKKIALNYFKKNEIRSLLEVGCGLGFATEKFASALPEAKLLAVDLSENFVKHTKDKLKANKHVKVQKADVTQLPMKANRFDACYIERVLHHLKNSDKALKEMARVVKPGGLLVVNEPLFDSYTINIPGPVNDYVVSTYKKTIADTSVSGQVANKLASQGHEILKVKTSLWTQHTSQEILSFLPLQTMLDKAVKKKLFTEAQVKRYLSNFEKRSAEGSLCLNMTLFTTVARING